MTINLARKWRSKQFDEVVGQTLAIRLLKNSLYRDLIFPVYLLSGTRGTGKTSTARIFAAALNCKKLADFQKNPQDNPLPCLACESCTAMKQMMHPDVIEIDAASHTGVDNVRQIIEAASFTPVMGGKKIYLVDEAHMLSKAAFNAFLKILEEPPKTVVFMLITTDPHKIIPTVLSRCFQVFFDPIKLTDVVGHLTFVCAQEGIAAEPEALLCIAHETEGCMRDALNLLERLRSLPELADLASPSPAITKEMVLTVLGSIDDERIGQLVLSMVKGDSSQVLVTWQRLEMHRFSPQSVWEKLVEMLRRSLWRIHAVAPDEMPLSPALQDIVACASYEQLIRMLEICYAHELAFSKTTARETLLELVILKMTLSVKAASIFTTPSSSSVASLQKEKPQVSSIPLKVQTIQKDITEKTQMKDISLIDQKMLQSVETVSPVSPTSYTQIPASTENSSWSACLSELELIQDPLVVSIFKQCAACQYNEQEKIVALTFSQDLAFFKDWLTNTEKVWKPIIEKFYGAGTELRPTFDGISTKQRPLVTSQIQPMKPIQNQPVPQKGAPAKMASTGNFTAVKKEVPRPQQKLPEEPKGKVVSSQGLSIGSLVTQAFPGTLLVHDTNQEGV